MAVNRGFKGVWIPKEIWMSPALSLQEKMMVVEIDSLDAKNGCFAGNSHFAEFMGLSEHRVNRIISSLKEKKLLIVNVENIKGKTVRIMKSAYAKTQGRLCGNAELPPCGNAESSITNTYTTNTYTMLARKKKKNEVTDLMRSDAYDVLEAFKPVNRFWHTLHENPRQYNAAFEMIRAVGFDELMKKVKVLSQTNELEFFPRIYTPAQLAEKWDMLHHAVADAMKKKIKKIPKVYFS